MTTKYDRRIRMKMSTRVDESMQLAGIERLEDMIDAAVDYAEGIGADDVADALLDVMRGSAMNKLSRSIGGSGF